jgi:hypothetical protein
MFKRILLALTFVAVLGAAGLGMSQSANAWWGRGYYYRPYVVAPYYYGGAPYRTYYYGPRYYPGTYYYSPRYAYYPDDYYYGAGPSVRVYIR